MATTTLTLTEDERNALSTARWTAAPSTLEDDPVQDAIVAAVERLLAARLAPAPDLAARIAAEIARHEGVAFHAGDDRDWYWCACGGKYGDRIWPPRVKGRERIPVKVNSKEEHVAEAIVALLLADG